MSSKSSPSPASDKEGEEMQKWDTNGSTKDGNSSLKRVREGSLEPTQAESSIPDPIATKKNRIGGTSSKTSSGPNDIAEVDGEDHSSPAQDVGVDATAEDSPTKKEEKPVGEVRKKVEEMSYDEEKTHKASTDVAVKENGKEEKVEAEGAYDDENSPADSSWEKVEKDEVEGSNADHLKRKALNRSESSLVQGEEDLSSKRSKEAGTPLTEEVQPATTSTTKKPQTTFSSFASSASPFASIKSPTPPVNTPPSTGPIAPSSAPTSAKKPQATFGSFSGKSSPFASTVPSPAPTSSTPSTGTSSEKPVNETSAAPKKPQATFGSFSSSSSPFATTSTTKSTSTFGSAPIKGSAFGTYSSTSSAFSTKKSTPPKGESEAKSEAGPSSFGDILKEKGDDEDTEEKVEMQEQDVTTGEEDEETVFQTRTKLYTNEGSAGWKERGVGLLKLNVSRKDGSGARLVMRTDGVHRLILNSKLYSHLTLYPDGKMVRMTLPEDGKMTIVCFRMSNPKTVDDLCENIEENRPSSDTSDV
ncbi:uncharacterized protein I206_102117 [Kwoniella pini CBS 10737]|uniref:RanBD1 domain-containing protein n=1 Tax=Kwoniella pini CBS 10737 TaxID=1296096 RepID=A0A1B9HUS1_9TREE|nr:uncharacterized protein I206_06790 [Kwoniella pini CBS 10737]OCF47016.1 hypothetical protein I206_06790 [Kwoniella pini CBS 10737]